MSIYKLRKTIRNKILNNKDAVNSIYADEKVSFSINTDLCHYEKLRVCNSRHKYITTGNLIRIIENIMLRKLSNQGFLPSFLTKNQKV